VYYSRSNHNHLSIDMATAVSTESTTTLSTAHPRGLYTLFFTEMWERFSYYGMRAILILFMTAAAEKGGMQLADAEASAIYGLYTASVYLLSLPGGWLADNLFGQRRTVFYGGVIIMLGHIVLAIPNSISFFFGLALVAIGTGLLKPNISTMVGDLYPEGGARRDAGFSIFYMGINLGAILGQLAVGYLGEKVNWHIGFGCAAIGMAIGLVQYQLTGSSLGEVGVVPKAKEQTEATHEKQNPLLAGGMAFLLIVLLAVLQFLGKIDLQTATGIAKATGIIIVSVAGFFFLYVLTAGGLTADEKKRVGVIVALFIGAAMFWSGFEQAGSSLNLFASRYTDRFIFGLEMPASWLQSVNSIFVITLAPVMAALWIQLAKRMLNPSTPIKFALGLIFLGLGFLVMYFAAKTLMNGAKASYWWLVTTYFLHTVGELCLSPVGLSSMTKLAPKRYVGQMMGIWFVAASLGNLVAGLLAGGFEADSVAELPNVFWSVVLFGGGVAILFVVASPLLNRWIGKNE
jgi:proton-dependent oligopeptide transporter, POT family